MADLGKELDKLDKRITRAVSALDRRVMTNKTDLLGLKKEFKSYFKAFEKRMTNKFEHLSKKVDNLSDKVEKLEKRVKETEDT